MEYIKLSEMRGLPRIVSIQNAYNLTDRHFEIGMDEVCFRENVGLIAYSPLAFGQLSGKYIDNPKTRGRMTLFTSDWMMHYRRPAVLDATRRYVELARRQWHDARTAFTGLVLFTLVYSTPLLSVPRKCRIFRKTSMPSISPSPTKSSITSMESMHRLPIPHFETEKRRL